MARIFRRGRTYWCRAQRQNREFRRSLKTTDRAVAERRARAWLNELDAISWGEKPRHGYAEAEEKFIREHLTAIKPRAAQRYGVSLKHLSEHFGDKTLDQITSATLSDFETKRGCKGYRRQRSGATLPVCHQCSRLVLIGNGSTPMS